MINKWKENLSMLLCGDDRKRNVKMVGFNEVFKVFRENREILYNSGLRDGKLACMDGMHTEMVRELWVGFPFMLEIYKKACTEGCVPENLKRAVIIPMYKGKE